MMTHAQLEPESPMKSSSAGQTVETSSTFHQALDDFNEDLTNDSESYCVYVIEKLSDFLG